MTFVAACFAGWGQTNGTYDATINSAASTSFTETAAQTDLAACRPYRVTTLPGSHQFASDFIEAIATDPASRAKSPETFWALTADLSDKVVPQERALHISRSNDGGADWTEVARVDSRYFDASIGEGLRNGFSASHGGNYFVVTTQKGAFQVVPQSDPSEPLVKPIPGPRVPDGPPKIPIPKKPGDPVRANIAGITADGRHMILGYGYFDLQPQLFSYHLGKDGSWIEDGPLPPLPTRMDILSMQFGKHGLLYVGTGDQVYAYNLYTRKWRLIAGVGPDSAIHGMSVVGGLHLAACWGVYLPAGSNTVRRITDAKFLLHRGTDEAGPNLRAYSIEVDPLRPRREAVAALTGVYVTRDNGLHWRRLNSLPEEEFRTAHFNADGSILVSGIAGTFLVNPFSTACSPHLNVRNR